MTNEEIMSAAKEADDYADEYLQSKGEYHPDWHTVRDEAANAIESLLAENEWLKAELSKYRDAPVVAYATTNEEDDLTMLFFDEDEARKYSSDDEPIKLIVKPGE